MKRRQLLIAACPASVLAALSACQESASTCVDLADLSLAQASLRRSVNYVPQSTDPEKSCGECAFFVAGPGGSTCGRCRLFDNGPVDPGGHCDSWAGA